MPTVILAGLSGAGKTTVAEVLSGEYLLRPVNVGDALGRFLTGLDIKYETRAEIGTCFLSRWRPEDIAEIVLHACNDDLDVVIDGVRFAVTCEQLRNARAKAEVWLIEAPLALRNKRQGCIDSKAEDPRFELQIPRIRKLAQRRFQNVGSLVDLRAWTREGAQRLTAGSIR